MAHRQFQGSDARSVLRQLQALPLDSACRTNPEKIDDLSHDPELGRSKRDVMYDRLRTVTALGRGGAETFIDGKRPFSRHRPKTASNNPDRAKLLTATAGPFAGADQPARADRELFLNEFDSHRGTSVICTGSLTREGKNESERFVLLSPMKRTPQGEEKAFAQAWATLEQSRLVPFTLLEVRTYDYYRKLQEKIPDHLQCRGKSKYL